jgi:hypothetical protein
MIQTYLIEDYLNYIHMEEQYNLTEQETEMLIEMISKDDVAKFVKKQLKFIEGVLKTFKVNIKYIKDAASKNVVKLERAFQDGKTPEQISSIMVTDGYNALKKETSKIKDKFKEIPTDKKLWIALLSFIVIVYVATLISVALSSVIANPVVVTYITSIIVAPMIEEAAKNYFIARGMPWVGTGVVFGLELIQYMLGVLFSGTKVIIKFLALRIVALLMHFSTTYVQKKIIEKGEESGKDAAFKAWIVGVGIHMLWNLFATIYQKQLSNFVTK